MSKLKSTFILTLTACWTLSCTPPETGYKVEHYQDVKIEDLSAEIKIPSKAWDLLENKPLAASGHDEPAAPSAEHGGGEHGAPAGGGGSLLAKEFTFSEIIVYLSEKNDNVLKKPAYKIALPRGGGEIDLSQYMGISNGTFYVGFEFPEFTDAQEKKVLFVSRAKKRKIDEEVYGLGCNQFVDISTKFFEEMGKAGIKVNSTRERHVTVLGGHFLFSAQKGNTIFASQVTFKDSNHPNLFCEVP